MKKIEYIIGGILGAVIIVMLGISIYQNVPHQSLQANASVGVFYGAGTTNTSTTVNTTSTQILPSSWNYFARISNAGTSTVWCYADGKTAASSSVALNSGINIGMVSTTFAGEASVSFGSAPGANIPYVGSVNCIASAKTVVGVLYQ